MSSDHLSFLMQGTDTVYLIHFPMFHLARQRHQFIASVELSAEAKQTYVDAKKKNRDAIFILKTQGEEDLKDLVSEKKSFKASIQTGVSRNRPKT